VRPGEQEALGLITLASSDPAPESKSSATGSHATVETTATAEEVLRQMDLCHRRRYRDRSTPAKANFKQLEEVN